MMRPVYILSACAISPQHSFEPSQFLNPVMHTNDGKLFVVDADYRQFINPVAIRRMSRQMKMGISTGMQALQLAGMTQPDAIITGTGLGSMTDMEHFLKDMINLNEETLNPTYFIQSTYNSINGWLALQSKSTGYNQTYVNRGLSLELSLLDAQLLLHEAQQRQVALVGCFDELTPDYFTVKGKCDYWKTNIPDSLELLRHADTPGTIAGEGTAFFTLSNDAGNALAMLHAINMIQEPDAATIAQQAGSFLAAHDMSWQDIDLIVAGINGDSHYQPLYDALFEAAGDNIPIAGFKHLCGEYPTASGFALWLALRLLGTQELPEEILYRRATTQNIRNILVVNHYILGSCSMMLFSSL